MKANLSKHPFSLVIACAVLLVFCISGLAAENKQVKIAFVKIENRSMDPRYDYLEGILSGILLFDLANDPGILIVDRSSLDTILREQELALSDLASADKAVRVGRILGADYLLKGQYVFLGTEVMLNISLVEVETAKTLPFNDRGGSENLVHGLAERIIERLTGKTVALRSEEHERSIISLKDEKPGTIVLFCNLIRAEIFIDDQFVSYTTGKGTEASVFENIRPGEHTVRVRLQGFGVVKVPEITCSDWQETVVVTPGGRHVLRATISLINWQLSDLKRLFMEYKTIYPKDYETPFTKDVNLSFTDRKGVKHTVEASFGLKIEPTQAVLTARVVFDGKETIVKDTGVDGKKNEVVQPIDVVNVKLMVDHMTERRCYIMYRIERNDFGDDVCREE